MTPKEFLLDYNRRMTIYEGFEYGQEDHDLANTLREADFVYSHVCSTQRHWIEFDNVTKIENRYIHFLSARTTTDMSSQEAGWEFDWDDVYFVEPVEIKTITYKRIT